MNLKVILGAVVVAIAALVAYGVYWQVSSPEVIFERQLCESEQSSIGWFRMVLTFDGEKYEGGTVFTTAFLCGQLRPTTVFTMRKKGFKREIVGFSNLEVK